MPTDKSNRLLIVDGHAYAYRAFHAIRELSSPTGAPTNAIYGFIKMLTKLQLQLEPSHVVVVWDGGLSSERTAEHPDYKAQRPPMPKSLCEQIDQIGDYLSAAGIATYCRDGVEADDWIASFASHGSETMPVVIASSDKDFMQLVSPRIGLANPNDKSEKIWAAADVFAKVGVMPEQVIDWLALVGDAVDNIPGVPGVGPKTATDLLSRFGSVEGIYSRIEEVSSARLKQNLEAAKEAVLRNQRLIRLKPDGLAAQLDDLRLKPADVARLRVLYAQWGFKTMLAQIDSAALTQGALL
jgi:DNA polymerase-1